MSIMMQPGEALGLTAQVGAALAGFAGVVVVFRPDAVQHRATVDRLRFYLLLTNSIYPVAFSLLGIFLLTVDPPPESIWRWCSIIALVLQVPGGLVSINIARNVGAPGFKGVSKALFYPLFAVGVATMFIQLYNIAIWNWFWPFFAGIVVHLVAALLQFMRFVLLPPTST